ncbi:putative beta-lysine N-acetyltransferase [Maribacter confluentis]|uniref:Beta-lysine N-acetyltransferase n=1 Tax=Maribacter confluentis TaxID=1656093 RepID=A0ABT8RMU2_9FLAO|nr:putative beta-lysine N-acetyltransferase [Maribacter confluentis]MDO1512239.1 putative beta-lysine N-acetyltransferase [Maribacter confluentis]
MFEKIENIEGALVYHGNMHNRIYFTDADNTDLNTFVPKIKALAKQRNYEKILGRAPESARGVLQSNGFTVEAKIPGLYNGSIDGYFLADYVKKERHINDEKSRKTIDSVKTIAFAASKPQTDPHFSIPSKTTIRELDAKDFPLLEELHRKAYKYHPDQIKDVEYFLTLQKLDHSFYGLFENNELLVSAILDIHIHESNMEIVDFVTHPDYRGQNLSYFLVQDIKKQMKSTGCKTVYAMVRATSYGLNITFSKHGFTFAGTLTNNCMVRNTMESMNVWYYKNE